MYTTIKKIAAIGLCCLCTAANGAGDKPGRRSEQYPRFGGLALFQANRGSGLGLFYEYSLKPNLRLTGQVNFLMVKGSNDFPIYDYYTGMTYERVDKRRLALWPLQVGMKQILFQDQIANNFRPFLELAAGPVLALDPPNVPDFEERLKNIRTHWAPGLRLGGGVDFLYGPGMMVSLFVGYDLIKFARLIDKPDPDLYYEGVELPYNGQRNYSGLLLKIGFSKRY